MPASTRVLILGTWHALPASGGRCSLQCVFRIAPLLSASKRELQLGLEVLDQVIGQVLRVTGKQAR